MELESIQITLNSKFATNYINGSRSNCEFYLPQIEIPIQHHIYISVHSANIPYSFYNIDSTNNTLIYVISSISTTITITPGNYNAIQLAAYLQSLMPNFRVTYNSITNKFTFLNTTYNFAFDTSSKCFSILGFSNTNVTSILKSLTSDKCVNMQSKQCINIMSNFATGNISSFDMKSNKMLCCIPLNTQPYSNIIYENPSNFRSNLYTNVISYLNIMITDQENNVLDLNGLDWSLVLQLDIINFV